ncbi:hypothetical protein BY458DRAFT_506696 [Sporodiniella umbellata]|nr:hypothetical protein BY458DRAFT_506696 [Sporodiniella umbellata]
MKLKIVYYFIYIRSIVFFLKCYCLYSFYTSFEAFIIQNCFQTCTEPNVLSSIDVSRYTVYYIRSKVSGC